MKLAATNYSSVAEFNILWRIYVKERNFISYANKIKFERATKTLFNTVKG
jgi:hypothetical protein